MYAYRLHRSLILSQIFYCHSLISNDLWHQGNYLYLIGSQGGRVCLLYCKTMLYRNCDNFYIEHSVDKTIEADNLITIIAFVFALRYMDQ